ncbi:carboxymuconolactone decarboxylase family protein [Marinomonas agarivorans]|nr:carboxymuconolactone decarboxylase family protein [Marinomonas agarivorans]
MSRITFAEIPADFMTTMMATENYLGTLSVLSAAQLGLLRVYISQLNGCAYCIDMHTKEALRANEKEQRLYSVLVWEETSYYTEKERAVLAWAKSLTLLKNSTTEQDEAFNALSQFYSKADIANLTMIITQMNAWNRIAKSFGFEAGSYQAN